MKLLKFKRKLKRIKRTQDTKFQWYPYNTLSNLKIVNYMLNKNKMADWFDTIPIGARFLDIGCADGDVAFYFESLGYNVDAIDRKQTNFNELKGFYFLKQKLKSKVEIKEMDIDRNIQLPKEYYLTFAFGLLYHLRNPFYFLNLLCLHSEYVLLSTRIASNTPDGTYIKYLPVAYLVGNLELNNDPTNYWIFSFSGIKQLIKRSGFSIICEQQCGQVDRSTPHRTDMAERYFALLKRKKNYHDIFVHHSF